MASCCSRQGCCWAAGHGSNRTAVALRVLLVNPPLPADDVYGVFASVAPRLPPLGLCYLGSFLIRAGHRAAVLDAAAEGLSYPELRLRILQEAPHVVGVTATTVAFDSAKRALQIAKSLPITCLTLLGGAHISAAPVEAMNECVAADIGVVGEGERTLLEICDRYESHQPLDGVPGTVVRGDRTVRCNPPRELERDIDRFPMPGRSLLGGMRRYTHSPLRGEGLTVSMVSSRGCLHRCAYCDQSVYGRTWRAHSAERVVAEMKMAVTGYGADWVSLEDDNFLLKEDRVWEICRLLRREGPRVRWGCSVRTSNLHKSILDEMKSAGCEIVYVGIETASRRLLALLNRSISKDQTQRGVELIKQTGMKVYGSFILGIPSETKQEMLETLDYSLALPLDGVSYFLYVPYPGTSLRELAREHGTVSASWSDYSAHSRNAPFVPRGMGPAQLGHLQREAYRRFYLRWGYVRKHATMALSPSVLKRSGRLLVRLILG